MSLEETLILSVGSAIAGSIFKLWVKDIPVLQDVPQSIMDILSNWTSDKIAQRKAQRRFEEMGEEIGKSLIPLFEVEKNSLDEGGRTAVALEVAETFKRAPISSKLIVRGNLEPLKLRDQVLAANPTATIGFNETENSLYHRIIKESCEYIVDIASQLPNFSERSFAEILRREDHLLSITTNVLEELPLPIDGKTSSHHLLARVLAHPWDARGRGWSVTERSPSWC